MSADENVPPFPSRTNVSGVDCLDGQFGMMTTSRIRPLDDDVVGMVVAVAFDCTDDTTFADVVVAIDVVAGADAVAAAVAAAAFPCCILAFRTASGTCHIPFVPPLWRVSIHMPRTFHSTACDSLVVDGFHVVGMPCPKTNLLRL